MAIKEILLQSAEAIEKQYNAGEYVFREGAILEYYYQIIEGMLKLNSYNNEGKEFIQNILLTAHVLANLCLYWENHIL